MDGSDIAKSSTDLETELFISAETVTIRPIQKNKRFQRYKDVFQELFTVHIKRKQYLKTKVTLKLRYGSEAAFDLIAVGGDPKVKQRLVSYPQIVKDGLYSQVDARITHETSQRRSTRIILGFLPVNQFLKTMKGGGFKPNIRTTHIHTSNLEHPFYLSADRIRKVSSVAELTQSYEQEPETPKILKPLPSRNDIKLPPIVIPEAPEPTNPAEATRTSVGNTPKPQKRTNQTSTGLHLFDRTGMPLNPAGFRQPPRTVVADPKSASVTEAKTGPRTGSRNRSSNSV